MFYFGNSEAGGCTDASAPPFEAFAGNAKILVLNSNRFECELLRNVIADAVAHVPIATVVSLAEASHSLAQVPASLLVSDIVASDGDVLGALPDWLQRKRCVGRALIASSHTGPHIVETARRYAVCGFFDLATESTKALQRAVRIVAKGVSYWSPSIAPGLANFEPTHRAWHGLTRDEKAVLTAIGTGADDKEAAAELNASVDRIREVRRRLQRKLDVTQRVGLMRAAESFGCIVYAAGRMIRPGYADLLADFHGPDRDS